MGRVPFPIDPLLPEIVQSVRQNPLTLLQAEPGAGKTTRVPPALLNAGLEKIYVLEPRRLAARMAARRVAEELGDAVGQRVGYQVRFEECGTPQTKLWFVTEGVLTRRLLSGSGLRGMRTVILDEFHERHLETDLALALLRKLQAHQPDLRLLIMSATLHLDEMVAQLGEVPIINAPGKLYPVSVRYTPASSAPVEQQVAEATGKLMAETSGHVLVFLPGAAEIRKTMSACERIAGQHGAKLLPLHGDLSTEEQDAAVRPSERRKILCATNIAESSVTIDSVTAVIDSGVARVMTHSPWSGISRLQVERISKASAIQRAGRAGRTGVGIAVRLYSEDDFVRRVAQSAPEILRADLAQLVLQLAAASLSPEALTWLTDPRPETLAHSRSVLMRLGALDEQGRITGLGKRMALQPVHPRLARFFLAAAELGAACEGCALAARLAEGRIRDSYSVEAILDTEASYTIRRLTKQLSDAVRMKSPEGPDPYALEKALLLAYNDRVARRRGSTLLLSSGGSVTLGANNTVTSDFLVALEIDDRSGQASPLVHIASEVKPDWLLEFFADQVETHEEMAWNREAERVEQVNALRYGQLTIDESRGTPSDSHAAATLLAGKATEAGIERFTSAEELHRFLRRVEFAAAHDSSIELPLDLQHAALTELATALTSFAELREAAKQGHLIGAMAEVLPMGLINEVAPEYIQLPSGRRVRIEYHEGRAPSVASRLQDFFGMKQSPTVARGSVPLVVHLLAPNQRPVQMTTDLVSFWKNLYPQVRRELSRRYPRHAWPESPS